MPEAARLTVPLAALAPTCVPKPAAEGESEPEMGEACVPGRWQVSLVVGRVAGLCPETVHEAVAHVLGVGVLTPNGGDDRQLGLACPFLRHHRWPAHAEGRRSPVAVDAA